MNQLKKTRRSKSGGNGQPCPKCCTDRLNKTPRNNQNQNTCTDLTRTPEHLRPGFRGQVRQYDPNDFGLTGNEEWRHPRMFRDMTYETDAAAMETFRQAQPQRRQPYSADMNISDLPEECLADMSPPGFNLSMESQMSRNGTEGECLEEQRDPCMNDDSKAKSDNEVTNYMDSVYNEISGRFKRLREHLWYRGSQAEDKNDTGPTPCDQQNQTSASSNCVDQAPACGEQGRHIGFQCQSENLADQSMPSFQESRLEDESMPCGNDPDVFVSWSPNECVETETQQPFERNSSMQQSSRRQQQQSMPTQNLWDISEPSMANSTRVECLEDISMPSFDVSKVSRSRKTPKRTQRSKSYSRSCGDKSAPTFASGKRSKTTCGSLDNMISSSPNRSVQQGRRPMTNECLDDMTMPSYGEISGPRSARERSLRRQLFSRPMQSSYRGAMSNECLEDMTMPSFGEVSNVSRGRSLSRQQRSMTNECLDDMTMPSFGGVSGSSRRKTPGRQQRSMTNECLDDMTMPSFGGVSGASRGKSFERLQRSTPNECLEDMTMPSFGGVSGASRGKSPGRQQRSMTNECLDDMTMPSFGGVSGSSRGKSPGRQQRSMTNECLEDMTMPSFGGVSGASRGKSPGHQQRSMTNECLEDMTMPSFGQVSNVSRGRSPGRHQRSMTNECLEDMTMPSFGGVSGASRGKSSGRQQRSMTNECLDDMTMPSFGEVSNVSKGRSTDPQQRSMTNECLEDMTMPSFGQVSNVSRGRSPGRQQRSMTNECLDDMTMPSFGGVSGSSRGKSPGRQQRSMTNECLEDMTMPSFGGVSGASRGKCSGRQQRSMTNECLEDMTMPSFGEESNVSRGRSTAPQQRPMTNECLEDMTMPSFGGVSGASRGKSPGRQQRSMTKECLEDMTMPSFGQVSNVSWGTTPGRQQKSMTNECLEDMTMPSFGGVSGASRDKSPGRQQRSMTNECLDDMTMPSFGGVSGSSRGKSPGRQQRSLTNECLEDMTMPSFGEVSNGSRGRSLGLQQRTMTNECLEDMTMPSFGGVSGASRGKSFGRQQRSITNECLEDMTMPSFGGVSNVSRGRSTAPQQRSMTNECLDDMTMPSFVGVSVASRGTSPGRPVQVSKERLEDVTMPSSFGGILKDSRVQRSRTPRRQPNSAQTQNISDISAPTFGSSGRGAATTNAECLEDVTMPSFVSSGRYECLQDVSMPSYERLSQSSRKGAMTNECLEDMTMPSYVEVSGSAPGPSRGRGFRQQQMSMTDGDKCLEDITMPSFGGVNGSSGRGMPSGHSLQRPHSNPSAAECVGMNAGARGWQKLRRQLSAPAASISERLQEANASRRAPWLTDECLEDVSMPQDILLSHNASKSVRRRAPDISYPSQLLADESAPRSFQDDTYGCPGPQSQQSSKGRPWINTSDSGGRLEDETMPSLQDESYQPHHQMTMPSEMLEDISDPYPSQFHDESGPVDYFKTSAPPLSSTRREKPKPKSFTPRRGDKSPTKSKIVAKKPAASRQVNTPPKVKNARSPGSPKTVQEVTVSTSTTSVTRTYTNRTGPGNISGQGMIEDMSMPSFESTRKEETQTSYLTDISEPTFGPSFNSTLQSEPNDESFHGFSSMENYAPFDDLVRSQGENSATSNQSQPQCPEQDRGAQHPANRSRNERSNRGRNGTASSSRQSYPYGKPQCYKRKPC